MAILAAIARLALAGVAVGLVLALGAVDTRVVQAVVDLGLAEVARVPFFAVALERKAVVELVARARSRVGARARRARSQALRALAGAGRAARVGCPARRARLGLAYGGICTTPSTVGAGFARLNLLLGVKEKPSGDRAVAQLVVGSRARCARAFGAADGLLLRLDHVATKAIVIHRAFDDAPLCVERRASVDKACRARHLAPRRRARWALEALGLRDRQGCGVVRVDRACRACRCGACAAAAWAGHAASAARASSARLLRMRAADQAKQGNNQDERHDR